MVTNMAITSFYLLNMFPRMCTYSSSPNNQYPTPKPNMFPRMRTLHHHLTINTQHPEKTCSLGCALIHHHLTINTQHPDQTCSLECALGIITQYSSPNTKTKHVPSDAHFASFGELFSWKKIIIYVRRNIFLHEQKYLFSWK